MKEFTITNIFKCWLKMWPITVILVILGLVGGVLMVSRIKPNYSAELSLLIVNRKDGSSAVAYAGLANSELVTNGLLEKAVVNDSCEISASGLNNVITFSSLCPTSADETKRLAGAAAANFVEWAQDIYGKENFKVTQLSKEAIITTSPDSTSKKIIKIIIPALVMLVASMVIAFIYLDYKVSKGNDKKA